MYDYREAMTEDVKEWIKENIDLTEWTEDRVDRGQRRT